MSDNSHEFDDYIALSPEDRMKARLQGLAEVISASGLPMLRDAEDGEEADVIPARVTAFSEGAAEFVVASAVTFGLSDGQIAALATELNLSEDRIVAALETVRKKL